MQVEEIPAPKLSVSYHLQHSEAGQIPRKCSGKAPPFKRFSLCHLKLCAHLTRYAVMSQPQTRERDIWQHEVVGISDKLLNFEVSN